MAHNKTNYYGTIKMTLIATDLCNRTTSSSEFVVSLLTALSPAVTNAIPEIKMNKADENITVQIPQFLFYDNVSNIALGFVE